MARARPFAIISGCPVSVEEFRVLFPVYPGKVLPGDHVLGGELRLELSPDRQNRSARRLSEDPLAQYDVIRMNRAGELCPVCASEELYEIREFQRVYRTQYGPDGNRERRPMTGFRGTWITRCRSCQGSDLAEPLDAWAERFYRELDSEEASKALRESCAWLLDADETKQG